MKTRTYESYKNLFEEVSQYNRLKKYHPSYILLFSFVEDRINRLYEDQFRLKHKVLPSKQDMLNSLYKKLSDVDSYGLRIRPDIIDTLNRLNERRNIIVHQALFHFDHITKGDVDELKKFGRVLDRIRKRQKKLLPKTSKVNKIKLRLGVSVPSVSKMRLIKNPTSYPLSHR